MKMIKITFEAPTRTALHNALREFLDIVENTPLRGTNTAQAAAPVSIVASEEHVAEQTAKNVKAAATLAEATTSSAKPSESPAAGAADECTYDDLKKSIMKLVAIDPKHMREIADSFGVKTFQGTAADVWPKAKKAVDDKIVALRG